MKISIVRTMLLGLVAAATPLSLFTGCNSQSDPAASSDGTTSTISLALQVGDASIDSVDYTITGPASFTRMGTLKVARSSTLSAVISGLPLGSGYQIKLTGAATNGATTCAGSASFDLLKPGVTPVSVHLQCTSASKTGSLMVNGVLNICPRIDAVEANPAEVEVGATIALTGLGVDEDNAPSVLTYAWTATSGKLAGETTASPTFTCTAAGPSTITLTVSDGDTCAASQTVNVVCSQISTDPGLKVAFIGDTDHGAGFKSVLQLVKQEGAQGLLVNGDMSYSENPTAWWAATEEVLGADFPVFLARGNHDDVNWVGFEPKATQHLGGATRVLGAHDSNYKTTWRGLVIAAIHKGDSPALITPFLQDEPHVWKVCQWHQNQKKMQIGGKSDEMGWGVYEACRDMGALIQTGHEHSYERTRTLVDLTNQIIDPTCSSPTELCLGPGRTFVTVSGLGGNSVRPQLLCLPATPPYGCNGEWASISTSNQNGAFGVQFITFNQGGPKHAVGYFKNVRGEVTDNFTINYSAFH
jgi:hypothetical protein